MDRRMDSEVGRWEGGQVNGWIGEQVGGLLNGRITRGASD